MRFHYGIEQQAHIWTAPTPRALSEICTIFYFILGFSSVSKALYWYNFLSITKTCSSPINRLTPKFFLLFGQTFSAKFPRPIEISICRKVRNVDSRISFFLWPATKAGLASCFTNWAATLILSDICPSCRYSYRHRLSQTKPSTLTQVSSKSWRSTWTGFNLIIII